MSAKAAEPRSFATDLDLSTCRAVQAIGDAQSALAGLTRRPELGFATDPAALRTELDKAMDQMLFVRRMILAAQRREGTE